MKYTDPAHYRTGTRCRNRNIHYKIALFILLLLPRAQVMGLSTDKDQPILIEADSVDIEDQRGISIYRGNVEVRQGSIILHADQVTVSHPNRSAEKLIAVGKPVKFRQAQENDKPDIQGEALRAEYLTNSEELFLIGDAVLFQGKDSFRSDRITYDRRKAVVKGGASAKGKRRVQVTIESKQ